MAEHLTEQTTTQVPAVLSPDALGLVPVNQLAEDGIDTVTQAAQYGAKASPRIPFPRSKGRHQGHTVLEQFLGHEGGQYPGQQPIQSLLVLSPKVRQPVIVHGHTPARPAEGVVLGTAAPASGRSLPPPLWRTPIRLRVCELFARPPIFSLNTDLN